jgi:hypothetical protein
MYHPKTLQRPLAKPPKVPAIKTDLDWAASGWAGLAAGVAFVLLETFMGALFVGGDKTDAVRRIASVALGGSVMPPGVHLTAIVFLAAAAVHIPLSLIYARVLAAMIDGMKPGPAIGAGALFGAALYVVNYYVFSGLFPWFVSARGPEALIAHLAFGMLVAGIYTRLARRPGEAR